MSARWLFRLAAAFSAPLFALGCADDPHPSKPLVFEKDVRSAYTMVRPCRVPGEHSGLSAYTVWVSKDAVSAYAELWQTPPAISRMPASAVVVKEVYTDTTCDPAQVARWVAVRKEPRFDPPHADWHWQEVTAPSNVAVDGIGNDCITCHAGVESCTGYGETGGRDYLCTAP